MTLITKRMSQFAEWDSGGSISFFLKTFTAVLLQLYQFEID